MDLHAKVLGDFTLLQVISVVVGIIVLSIVLKAVKGMMGSNDPDKFHDRKQCPSCGWVGTVSKFKPACGKCGNKSLIATR